jgi:site-specific DNA-methyltransferase (cytosine-N4-specific)
MIRLNRRGVKPTVRPSGHVIRSSFDKVGEGAIPGNVVEAPEAMLKFGNNAANDEYAKRTKELGLKMHPARFPSALPEFFVRLLTDEGDVVIDPFAGSNTTGVVSEILKRRWIAMEQKEQYLEASRVRFEQAPSEIADREKQTKLF